MAANRTVGEATETSMPTLFAEFPFKLATRRRLLPCVTIGLEGVNTRWEETVLFGDEFTVAMEVATAASSVDDSGSSADFRGRTSFIAVGGPDVLGRGRIFCRAKREESSKRFFSLTLFNFATLTEKNTFPKPEFRAYWSFSKGYPSNHRINGTY